MAENQFGRAIKKLWSDNDGEFDSQEVKSWMQEEGIQWEPSVAYAPEQNGVSERSNRTLLEKARTQLIQAGLPAMLWGESFNTAVYLANQSPTASLEIIPFEALYGIKPDVGNLRVFGYDVYVHDPHAKSYGKMAPQAWKGRLVGYGTGSNQYRIWNSKTRNVLVRQDITFNERKSSDTEEIVGASQTEDLVLIPDQSPENAEAAAVEETRLQEENLEPQAADNPGAEVGEEEGFARIGSPPFVIPRSLNRTTICHDYAKLNSHEFAQIAKGILDEPTLKEALAGSEAT